MPIGMLGIYRLLFVNHFVRTVSCKGYFRRSMTWGSEIWQKGRCGWVAGHLPFGEFWPRSYPPKSINYWTAVEPGV